MVLKEQIELNQEKANYWQIVYLERDGKRDREYDGNWDYCERNRFEDTLDYCSPRTDMTKSENDHFQPWNMKL